MVVQPAARASLLTFLIVGAGPTGVEMAEAIAELARNGMAKDFRNFDPASVRILLVQAGRRVLPQFNGSAPVHGAPRWLGATADVAVISTTGAAIAAPELRDDFGAADNRKSRRLSCPSPNPPAS
jgi:NADH dehydrogenase FAD-containing subunit